MANRVGQHLGSYRLLRLLGAGGFAEVYLGEHLHLKSQAAIKVLHTSLTKEHQQDFLAEAQTVARLRHPHIVGVLEFGIEDSTPYLVMDYAPHGTLRARHPKGELLPLATLLPSIRQVADALQYAHEHNIVHRDIKPENMLIDAQGQGWYLATSASLPQRIARTPRVSKRWSARSSTWRLSNSWASRARPAINMP